MKARSALRLTAILALAAAVLSCTAQGGSIYAIIESAQKTYVSTLDQTLTVIDIVNMGGTYPYLVAAGAVYKGTVPNANNVIGWPNYGGTPIPVRPPVSGALCTAMTSFNLGLYGAFFTSNGTTMGLYKSPAGPGYSFAAADGATAIPFMAGKQITLLQVAGPVGALNLFAVVATPVPGTTSTSGFLYELDYSSDGSTFAATSLTGLSTQITGVGYINGNYFVTSGSSVYSGALLSSPLTLTSIGSVSGEVLNGVTVDPAGPGHIFIPSNNGAVYYSTDGINWARAATSDKINNRSIIFLTVSTHVDTNGPGVEFLVGADGAGFYYLNLSANTLAQFSDVTVTGLYAGSVRRVLVDPSQNNLVFLGTAGTGLWRTTFDPATGTTPSTWIQE